MARDITERKRAQKALHTSEQRYRGLFENNVAGVALISVEGLVIDCNDAWARMFGHGSAAECRGGQIAGCYADPAERDVLLSELKRSDGTPFWILLNSVLLTEGPNVPLIQSTILDINQRKLAQEALQRREEDYRRFVAQSSEGIFRQDMDAPVSIHLPEDELVHHILFDSYLAECNDAIAQMYGVPSGQELVGKRLTETLDPNDPRNIELTREYIRSGFHVVERESHETDLHGNAKVFRNSMIGIAENGMLVRTGIQRDVTEQVRAEEARAVAEKALRKSEEHFRLLVEQACDGIFIADAHGKYLDANTAGVEMMGRTREELLELTIADLVVPGDIPRIELEVARFAGGATVRSEWTLRRKDGSTFPGEIYGKQLPDGRLQGILRDITERKLAEDAVRASEARERARANELQTVLDTLPIPVLISHDPECREITTNRAGAEYLRLPPGSNVSVSGPPEHRPMFRFLQNGVEIPRDQLPMQRAAATGLPVRDFSSKIILADGAEKYELGNAAASLAGPRV
jgi:PAS domain S-box-containing protein